jgi:hypothetical protein
VAHARTGRLSEALWPAVIAVWLPIADSRAGSTVPGLPEPSIAFPAALPTEAPARFSLQVKFAGALDDTRTALLTIVCKPTEIDCSPSRSRVTLGDSRPSTIDVSIPAGVNSAEIDAQIEADGQSKPAKSRFVNLGLSAAVSSLGSEGATDLLVSGQTRRVVFWLEDRNGQPLKPASGIQIRVLSADHCVDMKTVSWGGDPDAVPFSFAPFSAILDTAHPRMTQALYVHAPLWSAGKCALLVNLNAGDDQFDRPMSVTLNVQPHFVVVLSMCCLGALIQFLFAATIRLAALSKSPTPGSGSVTSLIFGRNGWQLLEVFAKGLAACVFALMLEKTNLFHFGSIDTTSLLSYGVFGFLIGFWSVDKIVARLRNIAHAGGAAGNRVTMPIADEESSG